MKPTTLIKQAGIVLAFIMTSSALETKGAIAQEVALARCESPSQSIQIYGEGDQAYLRALDRQTGNVWTHHTPVSMASTADGVEYRTLMGDPSLTVFVNANGRDCAVQVGSNPLEAGTAVVSSTPIPQASTNQSQILYSQQFIALESACQPPATLSIRPTQTEGQPGRLNFICWSSAGSDGSRSGEWLGNLPLNVNDPTFATSFTCASDDQTCDEQLTLLRSRYPDVLKQAELACSIRNGTLFFSPASQEIDLRCGYYATTFLDSNGDDIPDNEDSVSVDVSVGKLPSLQ